MAKPTGTIHQTWKLIKTMKSLYYFKTMKSLCFLGVRDLSARFCP